MAWKPQPDRQILRLSDLYTVKTEEKGVGTGGRDAECKPGSQTKN